MWIINTGVPSLRLPCDPDLRTASRIYHRETFAKHAVRHAASRDRLECAWCRVVRALEASDHAARVFSPLRRQLHAVGAVRRTGHSAERCGRAVTGAEGLRGRTADPDRLAV